MGLPHVFIVGWAYLGLRGYLVFGRGSATRRAVAITVWAIPIVAALVTLLVQWPIFEHYLNLLYGAMAIAAIAGSGLPAGPAPRRAG